MCLSAQAERPAVTRRLGWSITLFQILFTSLHFRLDSHPSDLNKNDHSRYIIKYRSSKTMSGRRKRPKAKSGAKSLFAKCLLSIHIHPLFMQGTAA
jgi:hypothetical protein